MITLDADTTGGENRDHVNFYVMGRMY